MPNLKNSNATFWAIFKKMWTWNFSTPSWKLKLFLLFRCPIHLVSPLSPSPVEILCLKEATVRPPENHSLSSSLFVLQMSILLTSRKLGLVNTSKRIFWMSVFMFVLYKNEQNSLASEEPPRGLAIDAEGDVLPVIYNCKSRHPKSLKKAVGGSQKFVTSWIHWKK